MRLVLIYKKNIPNAINIKITALLDEAGHIEHINIFFSVSNSCPEVKRAQA